MNEVEILLHRSVFEEAFEEMTFPAAAGNFPSHPDEKVSLRAVQRFQQASKALFMNGCNGYSASVYFSRLQHERIRKTPFFFPERRLQYL